ncbi:hypothetical protein SmJEL517_g05579 [Synchytrium microbalum]|uniref:Cytochrome c oxidase subunit n=1 Tax=Synchytrium microbalum TaxID=1806994 RepID=A0A507BZ20_9FUNG|nr:uncharacterized protein SmJEL517_g05579 [Synchytrium microbalum]TPX30996.1 hypothetical protein SmJEL517_g05579 [Synchytrium microbalum]
MAFRMGLSGLARAVQRRKASTSSPIGSVAFWWRINLFIVMPALILVGMYSVPKELEHIAHLKEHQKEFVNFPYLRKRKNPFPYGDGDHSLFANKYSNPDPKVDEE